ncbi:MAG: hypothetical protein WBB82_08750 [Limnothrix sp.]
MLDTLFCELSEQKSLGDRPLYFRYAYCVVTATWRKMLLRFISLSLFCYLSLPVAAVSAATCHAEAGQEVCLVSIKRSAKYFWEYRAVLKIDGKKQAAQKFDCRTTTPKKQGDRPSVEKNRHQFVCNVISRLNHQ